MSDMSERFRVGIIGAGWSAARHTEGWQHNPNAQVVAVADPIPGKAAALAEQYAIPEVLPDHHALLALDLDAVSVCTPNRAHTPVVVAALEAGKHVICEKPLATSSAEVEQMGRVAEHSGKLLMTAQNRRYSQTSRAIREWIDAGNLGEVYHARVRSMRRAFVPVGPGFIDKTLSGGGPSMDMGVHALDLCLWLMNSPMPTRVSGSIRVNFAKGYKIAGLWGEWDRERFSVEDFASGFVHFAGGTTMTFEASWLGHQSEKEDTSCELFGTEASVRWPQASFATTQGKTFIDGTLSSFQADGHTFALEIQDFYDAIVHGRPSPVPWQHSLKVISILEAIYASQERGAEVTLGPLEQALPLH